MGSVGRRHLRILKEIRPEIKITVVRSGKGSGCPEEKLADKVIFSLFKAIESGIQAAIISSPTSKHIKQANKLAEAGIHLLIEKPLSHSGYGINDLIYLVKKNKIVALIGYVMRHDKAAKKFKDYIDSKLLGELIHVNIECGSYLPDWRPDQNYKTTVSVSEELGGGVLLELSHELDYMRWFFGEMTHVYAQLNNTGILDINVEESADLIFTSEAGYSISVHLDFNRRYVSRKCIIQGANGELIWDAIARKVSWRLIGNNTGEDLFKFQRDDIFKWQLEHFLDCIKNGNKPIVTAKDAGKTVKLIEAAKKSYKVGKRVALV